MKKYRIAKVTRIGGTVDYNPEHFIPKPDGMGIDSWGSLMVSFDSLDKAKSFIERLKNNETEKIEYIEC